MMSTTLHQFAPTFDSYQSSFPMISQNGQYTNQAMSPGMAHFSQAHPYPMEQYRQSSVSHDQSNSRKRSISSRYGPYGGSTLGSTIGGSHSSAPESRHNSTLGGSAPVRRRISRACDQCNQLRTRCDGQTPCAHCVEFGLSCEYNRERKKRGKASRKDIQQQQAAAAAAANGESLSGDSQSPTCAASETQSPSESFHQMSRTPEVPHSRDLAVPSLRSARSMSVGGPTLMPRTDVVENYSRAESLGALHAESRSPAMHPSIDPQLASSNASPISDVSHLHMSPIGPMASGLRLNVFDAPSSYPSSSYHSDVNGMLVSAGSDASQMNTSMNLAVGSQTYMDQPYQMISPHTQPHEVGKWQPITPMTSTGVHGYMDQVAPTDPSAWITLPNMVCDQCDGAAAREPDSHCPSPDCLWHWAGAMVFPQRREDLHLMEQNCAS